MSLKIDNNIENIIIDLYNSDTSISEISRSLKVAKNTVLRVIKRNNIPRKFRGSGGKSKLSICEKQQIKLLYESGVHTS